MLPRSVDVQGRRRRLSAMDPCHPTAAGASCRAEAPERSALGGSPMPQTDCMTATGVSLCRLGILLADKRCGLDRHQIPDVEP
jgi:hypothetical protein